jgi:aquaporin related protein
MVITGTLPWVRGILLLPAQILGGIVAAALVRCMFPGPLVVNTTLANDVTPAQGVFIEMFLTSLLVFTILMLAAEKHYGTFMAPVGIGIALFVAMIAGMSLPISYIFIPYMTRYKNHAEYPLKGCTTRGPH